MAAWRLLPFASFSAPKNMAIDEAVFRTVQRRGGPPTLRLYGWFSPAVSIGYFQNAAAEIDLAACRKRGVTLVRRPTGGRAVYHDDDLTYAVAAPESDPLFPPTIAGTYLAISRCLVRGLEMIGLEASLASGSGEEPRPVRVGEERQRIPATGGTRSLPAPSCFAVPSLHELLVGGRKICGSAQLRSRGAFLQQGSLLMTFDPEKTATLIKSGDDSPLVGSELLRRRVTSVYEHLPRSVTRDDVCRALLAAFQEMWTVSLTPGVLTAEEEEWADRLLATRYGQERWNREGSGKRFF